MIVCASFRCVKFTNVLVELVNELKGMVQSVPRMEAGFLPRRDGMSKVNRLDWSLTSDDNPLTVYLL